MAKTPINEAGNGAMIAGIVIIIIVVISVVMYIARDTILAFFDTIISTDTKSVDAPAGTAPAGTAPAGTAPAGTAPANVPEAVSKIDHETSYDNSTPSPAPKGDSIPAAVDKIPTTPKPPPKPAPSKYPPGMKVKGQKKNIK